MHSDNKVANDENETECRESNGKHISQKLKNFWGESGCLTEILNKKKNNENITTAVGREGEAPVQRTFINTRPPKQMLLAIRIAKGGNCRNSS